MASLTANAPKQFQGEFRKSAFEVGANLEVFAGQCMMTGANGIVNSDGTGDVAGFSIGYANNLTNAVPHGGAARATQVELATEGFVWLDVANGAAFTHDDVGLAVYSVTDGNSFTTTAAATGKLGAIVNVDLAVAGGETTAKVLVYFNTGLAHLLASV